LATSVALRSALAFPRRLVVISARTMTTTPAAATIHHPGRVADANPAAIGPCKFAANIEPMTATPTDEPTWRLVEAMPDATPACDRGIPDTAEFVIGAFTKPIPMPNTRNAMTR
jgi:hypothetical protein